MNGGQLRRWAEDHGVDTSRVAVWNLRGMPNPLRTEHSRKLLAKELAAAGVEVLLIDTYARAALSPDENDNPAATAWFKMIGELTAEAGVTDVLVTHHAGWNGGRLRGASALQDFPDVLLGLTRDEQTGRRFLEATGRFNGADEGLTPTELEFDPATRTLTLTGLSKAEAKAHALAEEKADKELTAFLQLQSRAELLATFLTGQQYSQTKAFGQLKAQGTSDRKDDQAAVVAFAVEHYGVQVAGAGGPGFGGPKWLSRPVDTTDQSHQSGPVP